MGRQPPIIPTYVRQLGSEQALSWTDFPPGQPVPNNIAQAAKFRTTLETTQSLDWLYRSSGTAKPLQGAVADATSLDMTREELDAKLEAAEARSETRFTDLHHQIAALTNAITGDRGVLAEIREMKADNATTRILARQEGQFTRWTLFGIAVAIIGSFIAIVAFGGDQLGAGRELGAAIASIEAKLESQSKVAPPEPAAPSQPAPTAQK